MSTNSPNVFASPASQPQASVMQQFPQSGIPMTPGQTGIANFRARGGVPLGSAAAMSARTGMPPMQGNVPNGGVSTMPAQLQRPPMAPPQDGPAAGPVQTVQVPGAPMTPPQEGPGMSAQPGQMPGRIRPPSAGFLQPRRSVAPPVSAF